jgi:predicted MPP superfamily phosphohydrolase
MDGDSTLQGTLVIMRPDSKTKLKIVTVSDTLRLKTETKREREKWFKALVQEIQNSQNSLILSPQKESDMLLE